MIVAGALIALFGFAFLVTALITVPLAYADARLRRRLLAAPRLTCAELRSCERLPATVLVTGRTAPGQAGELRSPAYDTICAWYETTVSTGVGLHDRTTYLQLSEGGETVRVDDGSGSVFLAQALLEKGGIGAPLRQVRDESTPVGHTGPAVDGTGIARLVDSGLLPTDARPRFGRRHLDLTERTIAAGLPISVLARPERTAHHESVLLRRKGAVAAGDPDQWIAALERDAVTSRWMILIFPLIGVALLAVGVGLLSIGA